MFCLINVPHTYRYYEKSSSMYLACTCSKLCNNFIPIWRTHVQCTYQPVPYALRTKVEQELDRLEKSGIIEPVQFSEWAAPIVPVVKRDGAIRVCGDYKLTANQASKLDTYPLPKIDVIFAQLSGG